MSIKLSRLLVLAIAVPTFAFPCAFAARASSCDQTVIDRLSVEQAAERIWNESDVIGFGIVSTVDTPEREQQFVDMVLTLKGPADQRIAYVPLRIGRVGAEGPGMHRIGGQDNWPTFVAFAQARDGYIEPLCQMWLFNKDRPGIIRRLVAMSRGIASFDCLRANRRVRTSVAPEEERQDARIHFSGTGQPGGRHGAGARCDVASRAGGVRGGG